MAGDERPGKEVLADRGRTNVQHVISPMSFVRL